MEPYIIMCRSLTYAQKSAKLAQKAGFYASVIKAPPNVSDEGCSYGIKVRRVDVDKILDLLKTGGISTGRVIALDGGRGGLT